MKPLYYESHVTIEPVFGSRLERFKFVAARWGFHVATLLLQKNRKDTEERSNKDAFCTGRSEDRKQLTKRMDSLVLDLQACGFQVWRYKIEAALIDVKLERKISP
jgi:hypothetical protein